MTNDILTPQSPPSELPLWRARAVDEQGDTVERDYYVGTVEDACLDILFYGGASTVTLTVEAGDHVDDVARKARIAGLDEAIAVIRRKYDEAVVKAFDSLGRYKYEMFGYWAAASVKYGQLIRELGVEPPASPFRDLVHVARALQAQEVSS